MGSILPCCLPFGKAGGLQILCCQGIEVTDYNFTLDALALKPSDFCNVRVSSTENQRLPAPLSVAPEFGIKIRIIGYCPAVNRNKTMKGEKKGNDCNQIVGETAGLSALS